MTATSETSSCCCSALPPLEKPLPTNLDDAVQVVAEIDKVRAVQRELRSAFARSELDGGAKAALNHPLYLEAATRLDELHDELMGLI
jgi:hypothetical protein